jgi:uncharacterized repeat protein (TIGR02543 family)
MKNNKLWGILGILLVFIGTLLGCPIEADPDPGVNGNGEKVTITFNFNYPAGADGQPADETKEAEKNTGIGSDFLIVPAAEQIPGDTYEFDGWYTEQTSGYKVGVGIEFEGDTTLYARWRLKPVETFFEMDLSLIARTQDKSENGFGELAAASTTDGVLTANFSRNNERIGVYFTAQQIGLLETLSEVRFEIDGEAIPDIDYRYFIGTLDTSGDWNGTNGATLPNGDAFESTAFSGIVNGKATFIADNLAKGGRLRAFILQARTESSSTATIRSIKVYYDKNVGGEPPAANSARVVTLDRNIPGSTTVDHLYFADDAGSLAKTPLPRPSRNLYRFTGWYTEASGGTKVADFSEGGEFNQVSPVPASTTLYAQWETLPTITISYNLNYAGAQQAPANVTIEQGGAIGNANLPQVTRAGFLFNGWSKGADDSTIVLATDTFNTDTTLYAQWEDASGIEYTVTFVLGYGDNATHATKTVTGANSTIGSGNMPSEPTRDDFTFAGWVTGTEDSFTGDTPITGNITVRASWTFDAPEPGSTYVINLDLSLNNLATTQYTGDTQWMDRLAAPSAGNEGELILTFDPGNYASDNATAPRQRALIRLSELDAAYANAGTSYTVEIDGTSAPDDGTNYRYCLIISPQSAKDWNSTSLQAGKFSEATFKQATLTRQPERATDWFMIASHDSGDWATTMTATVTIRSIKITVTF